MHGMHLSIIVVVPKCLVSKVFGYLSFCFFFVGNEALEVVIMCYKNKLNHTVSSHQQYDILFIHVVSCILYFILANFGIGVSKHCFTVYPCL